MRKPFPSDSTAVRVARPFASLAGAVLLLGTADSMLGSYSVLFAADAARLTPVQVGLFVSAPAAGGMVVSLLVGRRFDRRPTRAYAVAAAALPALGVGLLTTTTSFPLLLGIAGTLLATGQAAFPQLFALAREVLGDGRAGQRSVPLLRSSWSLAWALGPLVAGAVLAHAGFPGLLWTAAGILALTAVVTATVPAPGSSLRQPQPVERARRTPVRPPALALVSTGVALFFLAVFAGSVALPLFVTRALDQPDAAVGLLFSACAVVEVLAALPLAALPGRGSQRNLLLAGMVALVAYFALVVAARGMVLLLVAQVARGIAIAVVAAAGIRFFQDLLAPATGRATTLFSNAVAAGGLLAGVLAGLSVQHWGTRATLVLCGAAASAAALVFWLGTSARLAAAPEQGTPLASAP